LCDLSKDKRLEIEGRYLRGDTLASLADLAEVTLMTVKRHFDNGHYTLKQQQVRAWMEKHAASPSKAIERARTMEIEKAPVLTPEDISARLLALERYAMRVLASLEADSDYRGSIQAVEALRRLTSDLATVNGAGRPAQDPDAHESVDTRALRESIEAMFKKGHDSPDSVPWQPLR
jgi:hypothetical protein